jgi:hypothetical protein
MLFTGPADGDAGLRKNVEIFKVGENLTNVPLTSPH